MNKRNGGIIPAISDERTKWVAIGCGRCIECMKKKKREWQIRLLEDVKENKNGKFVTLTFSNESIKELRRKCGELKGYELDNEIATKAVRLMLERWRKKNKKSLRHWFITELGHGETEHIHLHGIIWADEKITEPLIELQDRWGYGWVWKGNKLSNGKTENYVNGKTVNYIIKYIQKIDEQHKEYKAKILCTAGIGKNYINSKKAKDNVYKGKDTNNTYTTDTGHEIMLTEYWKKHLYSEAEREQMWIDLLDKQERYIMGNRIDISKGEEEYYKALKWYQEKNRRLGYGDDTKNWNRIEYENKRREIKINQRIKGKTIEQELDEIRLEQWYKQKEIEDQTEKQERQQEAINWNMTRK